MGGGTSDFSLVRLGPDRVRHAGRSADILATTGVHIGGTDFDRELSVACIMPLLGFGHAGSDGRQVPHSVFHDLATWHLINFQYTPAAVPAPLFEPSPSAAAPQQSCIVASVRGRLARETEERPREVRPWSTKRD